MGKKTKHGGKRPGSGRKKADYETTTVSFRVKVEHADEIRGLVQDFLDQKEYGRRWKKDKWINESKDFKDE